MEAGGAELRGFLAFVDVAAVEAAPDDHAVALEDFAGFEVLPEVVVALLVLLLGDGDALPEDRDLGEAFFAGDAGELGVGLGPFFVFAGGGRLEVFEGVADDTRGEGGGDFDGAAFEVLEEALGVFLFLEGGLLEDLGNLDEAFLLRDAGEEVVAVAGLRFPGEGVQQVLFGAGSLDACHLGSLFLFVGVKNGPAGPVRVFYIGFHAGTGGGGGTKRSPSRKTPMARNLS